MVGFTPGGQPDIQSRLLALGAKPAPSTPAQFDKLVVSELARIAELARRANITQQ